MLGHSFISHYKYLQDNENVLKQLRTEVLFVQYLMAIRGKSSWPTLKH